MYVFRQSGVYVCACPYVFELVSIWLCVCLCVRVYVCTAQERLFEVSDAYRIHVCERSGLIAIANLKKQQFISQIYKNDSTVVQVSSSRACTCLYPHRHACVPHSPGVFPRLAFCHNMLCNRRCIRVRHRGCP